ncbi:MAG: DUF4153 domain-containing protein [Alistipes sp.]
MLQEKLRHFACLVSEEFIRTLRRYPVELLSLVYACVGCSVAYGVGNNEWLLAKLAPIPIFAILSLCINMLTIHNAWRPLYWMSWIPLVPLSMWSGLAAWVDSESYTITLAILAPLTILMSRKAIDNLRFVIDALIYLRAAIVALFFTNAILALFCAILYSTAYIFNINGAWVSQTATYSLIITETLLAPSLFLMLIGRWLEGEIHENKLVNILLNYIATPAVLVYLSILYLYITKIIIQWSLPQGGVAYMIFGFMIFTLIIKALQEIISHHSYDWFFDHFSLFALPALLLFWIGVVHRIDEYGLTEPRVWLVACGIVMSICLLQFLSRHTGRYLYLCIAAFLCFGSMAFVPALQPAHLAAQSQRTHPQSTTPNERIYLHTSDGYAVATGKYTTLYTNLLNTQDTNKIGYYFDSDTLRIHFGNARSSYAISGQKLLETQLRKIGMTTQNRTSQAVLNERADELLTYADDEVQIVFSSMQIDATNSHTILYSTHIDVVMTR